MQFKRFILHLVYFIFLIQLTFTSFSFGYLDLGSGSYLLQIILGFLLAGLYMLRHYWKRLFNWFKKNKKDSKDIR